MNVKTRCFSLTLLFAVCGAGECWCEEEEELGIPRKSFCDSPEIPSRDGVNVYNRIDGFGHENVTAVYDDRINRTEFLSATIHRDQLRYDRSPCPLYRANASHWSTDVDAQIVAYQLGGSCDRMNRVQLRFSCVKGMLLTFENWVKRDVEMFIKIKYCVRMLYADDAQRRPYKIVYRAYTQPFNRYLHSIALDNPYQEDCKAVPHVM